MGNCEHSHDAMQYCIMKGDGTKSAPDLLLDVKEYECINDYFENDLTYPEIELEDGEGEYIIAYGKIMLTPIALKDPEKEGVIGKRIYEENMCHLVVNDDAINQIEVVKSDIILEMPPNGLDYLSVVSIIRTPFKFSTYGQQCVTAFLKYNKMSCIDNIFNRNYILSYSYYEQFNIENIETWHEYVNSEEAVKSCDYIWTSEVLEEGEKIWTRK